jgi:RNA polymerase sigma-70 factor, ECF subfamily
MRRGLALTREERNLILSAVKRDREAFAKLYVKFYPLVLARVLPITRNRDEAEDFASETFVRAWNAIDRFEARDVSIAAWLCTIAERLALTHVKSRRPSLNFEEVELVASSHESPELVAERKSDSVAVRTALMALPRLQRQVLSQRFLDELSHDDVAVRLARSVGSVRVIQHRALLALRGIMRDRGRPGSAPNTGPGGLK